MRVASSIMLLKSEQAETSAEDAFLHDLGQHVRRVRAQRGMSRRILAAASGVSERYIAQLESGKGNASILVLRAIARAMDVLVDDLVDETRSQPIEYAVLRERLRAASAADLKALLDRRDGIPERPAFGHLALIGLRGAGKSTLGAALAKRLGVPFVELVQEIERMAGTAVSDILTKGGQPAYRRYERAALEASLDHFEHAVIAVGGSLVSEPETFSRLLTHCFTIWLQASPRQHMERVIAQGDHRPMADNRHAMRDLERILDERAALYARAHFTHDTTPLAVEQSLAVLLDLPVARALNHHRGAA